MYQIIKQLKTKTLKNMKTIFEMKIEIKSKNKIESRNYFNNFTSILKKEKYFKEYNIASTNLTDYHIYASVLFSIK